MKYFLPTLIGLGMLYFIFLVFNSSTTIEITNTPTPTPIPQSKYISAGTRPVTGYSAKDSCSYPAEGGCLTASGKIASVGMVACPRAWKFGTKVQIGDDIYTCEDRLATRFDNRVDIWFENQEDAITWGKKNIEVKIQQ